LPPPSPDAPGPPAPLAGAAAGPGRIGEGGTRPPGR